mmetsp:Transcript_20813/g.71851  ORF Transcript_20813/g.71851 Transcript_20813/m.71851 type:complete len:276 (-) Transcript_20813:122-949(-)
MSKSSTIMRASWTHRQPSCDNNSGRNTTRTTTARRRERPYPRDRDEDLDDGIDNDAVVDAREWRGWRKLAQELAQRAPTLLHIKLQQPLLWHRLPHKLHPCVVARLQRGDVLVHLWVALGGDVDHDVAVELCHLFDKLEPLEGPLLGNVRGWCYAQPALRPFLLVPYRQDDFDIWCHNRPLHKLMCRHHRSIEAALAQVYVDLIHGHRALRHGAVNVSDFHRLIVMYRGVAQLFQHRAKGCASRSSKSDESKLDLPGRTGRPVRRDHLRHPLQSL